MFNKNTLLLYSVITFISIGKLRQVRKFVLNKNIIKKYILKVEKISKTSLCFVMKSCNETVLYNQI